MDARASTGVQHDEGCEATRNEEVTTVVEDEEEEDEEDEQMMTRTSVVGEGPALRRENEALKAHIAALERRLVETQQLALLQRHANASSCSSSSSSSSSSSTAPLLGGDDGGGDIVMLNVGGKYFSSLRSTLCRFEGTFLEALGSGRHDASAVRDPLGCYFIDRDPTHFGLVLSFLRDQSFRIQPPISARLRAKQSRSGGTAENNVGGPAIEDDDLRDTIALVVELDYYGILGYVVPKQVREEVDQWAKDFVDVFSVEQYHHQVARLWVDSLAREADVAESYYRKAIDFDLSADDSAESTSKQNSKQERYSRAVKYYHKAASRGHIGALFNLAVCHMDGDGVPVDPAKAVRFLLKAAEAGHKQAQYQLALCYKQGKGVPSDKREAVYWFRQAAMRGHTTAQAFLQDTTWQLGQRHLCAWE